MRLAWSNAKLFNREGSDLWMAADRLSSDFEALFCEWVINPPDGYGWVWVWVWRMRRATAVISCFLWFMTVSIWVVS